MTILEKISFNIKKTKYNNITTTDQLPCDKRFVLDLRNSFESQKDFKRAFLCAKKAKELGSKQAACYLAWHYWNGYGVEKNTELARKHQLEYYLNTFRSNERLFHATISLWWNGSTFMRGSNAQAFVDCSAMKEVARDFILRSDPRGVFLLEDAILAEVCGIQPGASPKEQRAVWMTIKENPHAKYYIDNEKEDLYAAAEGGSYFAWEKLKRDNYFENHHGEEKMQKLLEEAEAIMQKGYDYANALFTERAKQVHASYALLAEGEKEVQSGNESGWNKIHAAASMGNKRAEVQSYQKLAQEGQDEAQRKLAEFYLLGCDNLKKDIEQAILLFNRSAESGNADSQYRLASILEYGSYGVHPDMDQALQWYTAAASQKNRNACLRMAEWHSKHSDLNRARAYLEPFLHLDSDGKESQSANKEILFALLQVYRKYECRNDIYPELENALAYAFEIACADLKKSDSKPIQSALTSFAQMKMSPALVKKLSDEYHTMFKESLDHDEQQTAVEREAVYETFMLWYIMLKEVKATYGDLDAMIGLYSDYKYVGAYTLHKLSDYDSNKYSVRFRGNKQKSIYWVEQAISRGDVTAMEIKGEDWKFFGISEQEGEKWLKEAQFLGSISAAETLKVNRLVKEKEEAFERNVQEFLRCQANNVEKRNAANALEKKSLDAVFSVHMMPSTITGPYNLTYRQEHISAFSAEYRGEHGDLVVIRNEDIGGAGTSAKTPDGYFYW